MSGNKIRFPFRAALRAEREQVKAEIAEHRGAIARMRAGTAEAQRRFADSFDCLAESQKLTRRLRDAPGS